MTYIPVPNGSPEPIFEPRTHVFIIGVGEYPAFRDCSNQLCLVAFDGDSPKPELTSSPRSALHLANWFISNPLANPECPLGSLELLLSPEQDFSHPKVSGCPLPLAPAKVDNIQASFLQWYRRCDTHPNNTAIFYFVGHGADFGGQLLFAQDMFEFTNDPLKGAIDLNGTVWEMSCCEAETQCFFIDACRLKYPGMIQAAQLRSNFWDIQQATTLGNPLSAKLPKPCNSLQLFATQLGQSAWGNRNSTTLFCEALSTHLDGLGAKNQLNQWIIDQLTLGNHLKQSMDRENKIFGHRQSPEMRPVISRELTALRVLPDAPEIPIRLSCVPHRANSQADFRITCRITGKQLDSLASMRGEKPWEGVLKAGPYWWETQFPTASSFKNYSMDINIITPFTDIDLEVLE